MSEIVDFFVPFEASGNGAAPPQEATATGPSEEQSTAWPDSQPWRDEIDGLIAALLFSSP